LSNSRFSNIRSCATRLQTRFPKLGEKKWCFKASFAYPCKREAGSGKCAGKCDPDGFPYPAFVCGYLLTGKSSDATSSWHPWVGLLEKSHGPSARKFHAHRSAEARACPWPVPSPTWPAFARGLKFNISCSSTSKFNLLLLNTTLIKLIKIILSSIRPFSTRFTRGSNYYLNL
jgi:hypothetical protein